MKVISLDGKESVWNLSGRIVSKGDLRPRSQYHLQCRKLLKDIFPLYIHLEEVPIPNENLTLDFYIPQKKLAIEVNGEGHYKHIPHFHGSKKGFLEAKKRDTRKKIWCDTNNIFLLSLSYTDSIEEWERQLRSI